MRYLPILLILAGCSSIKVTESDGQCTVSGVLLEPRDTKTLAVDFDFHYTGERCEVVIDNRSTD